MTELKSGLPLPVAYHPTNTQVNPPTDSFALKYYIWEKENVLLFNEK